MNKKAMILIVIVLGILAIGGYIVTKAKPTILSRQKTMYHVGILSGLDLFAGIADSFKQDMTALGYVEGKNITYDLQKTNYEPEKDKQILKKFVSDNVDLVLAYNTEAALEAKDAIKGTSIPLVFANAFTEGNNLINSIRAPGGNITGVRYPNTDVAIKRLEVLHEIVPQAKRIWLPYQKNYPSAAAELAVVRPAAKAFGLTLIEFPSENLTALQTELENRTKNKDIGFDAVLFIPESLSTTKEAFAIIAKYTKGKNIPVGGSSVALDNYGTIFAVTVDNAEIGKLAAVLADKIFRGMTAGTLPVVSPETYLIANVKVASSLGIPLPEDVLNQANKIMQ